MSSRSRFSGLAAPNASTIEVERSRSRDYDVKDKKRGFGFYLIWFIIIALVSWFVLYIWKPTWVQKKTPAGQATGQIDGGSILLWSVIISLVIVLIIWLFQSMA